MFYFLCTLLLILYTPAASANWIKPLPDGLKVTTDNDVNVVRGEWTVLITIEEPRPPRDLFKLVQRTRTSINLFRGDLAAYTRPYQANWHVRLREIEKECETPHRWWRRQDGARRRRGLIDGIGSALNYLFGVATDDQIGQIQETIRDMSENQKRIVNYIDQFTSVLNHTYDEIQANRNQINVLNQKLRDLASVMRSDMSTLQTNLDWLSTRITFETIISQLEDVSHRYVRSYEAWLHRKENLEAGRLTENLLPPTVLQEILSETEDEQAFLIQPLQWYYEHFMITPIWVDTRLIYRTRLPVVSGETWHHVTLRTWPAPVRDYQMQLVVPEMVLRNTDTSQLDTSPNCYGTRPRICRPGLVSAAGAHPCVTRLLAEKPDYASQCVVEMTRRAQHYYADETYILITGGTELTLLCTARAEQRKTVAPGVYEIRLQYPCSLQSGEWLLSSVFQRSLNITLDPQPVGYVINITLTNVLNNTLSLDPTTFDLDMLKPVDRKQVQVSDITNPNLNFTRKTSIWHSFWSLILVGLAGGAVYGRCLYVQRHHAKPTDPEIQSQETETAAQPTSTVFQFSAK